MEQDKYLDLFIAWLRTGLLPEAPVRKAQLCTGLLMSRCLEMKEPLART